LMMSGIPKFPEENHSERVKDNGDRSFNPF